MELKTNQPKTEGTIVATDVPLGDRALPIGHTPNFTVEPEILRFQTVTATNFVILHRQVVLSPDTLAVRVGDPIRYVVNIPTPLRSGGIHAQVERMNGIAPLLSLWNYLDRHVLLTDSLALLGVQPN